MAKKPTKTKSTEKRTEKKVKWTKVGKNTWHTRIPVRKG